jgi:prepilin-type N-terminal cleavage/methylation domain-containing protein
MRLVITDSKRPTCKGGFRHRAHSRAFTLIELLIVVAIIAILAAIAVPNFLEAQTRSRVARVKTDMRSMRTALECYRLDYNHYIPDLTWTSDYRTFAALTTPVAYMTSIPTDPFIASMAQGHRDPKAPPFFEYGGSYRDDGTENGWPADMRAAGLLYWILSPGPDLDFDLMNYGAWGDGAVWIALDTGSGYLEILYDATNGTKSSGDIVASNKRMYN